jgi:hypothetical protein
MMVERKSVVEFRYAFKYDAENREHIGLMLGLHNYLETCMEKLKEYGVDGSRSGDVLISFPTDYQKEDKDEKIEMLVLELDE